MGIKLSRRAVITAAGAAALPLFYRAAHAGTVDDFEIVEHDVALASIDSVHDGLRVAQLSDLHVGEQLTPGSRIRAALDVAARARVDLLVLTGDFLTHSRRPIELIETLLRDHGPAPAMAVLGNHDHRVDPVETRRRLEAAGITVLQNENTTVRLKGRDLSVVGIDDGVTGHDDAARALRGSRQAASRLVLTHSPPTAQKLPRHEELLCLAGHTHGGAVAVPGLTERLFGLAGQKWVRGAYDVGGNYLYVNRGLGMGRTALHPRVGSRPELTLFTLRSAEVTR